MCIKVEFADNSCACPKRKRQKDCEQSRNGECARMLCGTTDCLSAFRKKKSDDSVLYDNNSSSDSVSLLQNEVMAIKKSLDRMETKMEEKMANSKYFNMI